LRESPFFALCRQQGWGVKMLKAKKKPLTAECCRGLFCDFAALAKNFSRSYFGRIRVVASDA
jgi:hypothetical protein